MKTYARLCSLAGSIEVSKIDFQIMMHSLGECKRVMPVHPSQHEYVVLSMSLLGCSLLLPKTPVVMPPLLPVVQY